MTTADPTTAALVLHLARSPAASMDVPAVLNGVCAALPAAMAVAGAVILLVEPLDGTGAVCFASDPQARWIGALQHRAGLGPLPNALRTGRGVLTPDLTRIGPPELAAAAAQSGLVSSLALLLEVDSQRVGGLQLLGDGRRPVGAGHTDLVVALAEVIAARLVDVRELRRLRSAAVPPRPVPVVATARVPGPRPGVSGDDHTRSDGRPATPANGPK